MIVWIDGTFGAGKTAVANELRNRYPESDVIEFDEFVNSVQPENLMEIIAGRRFPEDKPCYVNAFIVELERKLNQNDKGYYIIPIALITDYCRIGLVENFKKKTETVHIILCQSKERLLERIKNQSGRDVDHAITYYDEATLYLKENYSEAIRINTDDKSIEEVADCIEKHINNRR